MIDPHIITEQQMACETHLRAILNMCERRGITPPGCTPERFAEIRQSFPRADSAPRPVRFAPVQQPKGYEPPRMRHDPIHNAAMATILAVAAQHGITVGELIGGSRKSHHITARRDAIMRLKDHYSFSRIGRWLGNRDHSTIMHYVRRGTL